MAPARNGRPRFPSIGCACIGAPTPNALRRVGDRGRPRAVSTCAPDHQVRSQMPTAACRCHGAKEDVATSLVVNPPREPPGPSPPAPPPPGGQRDSATASRSGVLPACPLLRREAVADRCARRRHAGALAQWWSRPRCPGRSHLSHRPRHGPPGARVPRFRRLTRGGVVRRPSSTSRTVRQVTPLNSGSHPMQNPVDHLSVIPPPPATPVPDRQERPQPFPRSIRPITPPHVYENDWQQGSVACSAGSVLVT
ncbi:hypothetical protein RKD49_007895 [Streptomyces glaucescens]